MRRALATGRRRLHPRACQCTGNGLRRQNWNPAGDIDRGLELVRASEVMLGTGLFGWMLRLLDTVGRTESAIDIYKFLRKISRICRKPTLPGQFWIVSGFLLCGDSQSHPRRSPKAKSSSGNQAHLNILYSRFPSCQMGSSNIGITALSVWLIYRSSVHSYLLVDSLPLPEFHAPSPSPPVPVIGSPKKPQPVSPTVVDQSPARPLPHPQVESSNQTSNQPAAQAAQPNIRSDNQLSQMAKVNSPPPRIIPDDPVKAVEAVKPMRNRLLEVLEKKDTITFLMTWPDDDNSYLAFIGQLLSSACEYDARAVVHAAW